MKSGRETRTREILGTLFRLGLAFWICFHLAGTKLSAAESNGKTTDAPLTTDQVVSGMVAANQRRTKALQSYTSVREYHLELHGPLHLQADMKVKMAYQWPGGKEFTLLSESGSEFIREHVLKRLIDAENEASRQGENHKVAITPENYDFELTGYENTGQGRLYILQAIPREKRKFLFQGRIWVNGRNFAITRIEGQPATPPSWWTTKVNFVYTYKEVGEFWLPALNETVTHVRVFGRSFLTIKYKNYDLAKPLQVKAQMPLTLLLSDQAPDGVLVPRFSSSD